jgi:coproporphyrinogen III oxidase-like Fe-S oxidoreductase
MDVSAVAPKQNMEECHDKCGGVRFRQPGLRGQMMRTTDRLLGRYLRGAFANLAHFDLGAPVALPEASRAHPDVLYIHIPFCESLCPFCSFHRVKLDRNAAIPYFNSLRTEIRAVADKGFKPTIVYVGGGTPTVLPDELAATLDLARSLFPIRQISIETNPNHLRQEILSTLKSAGVNRVSVGVQSFDDDLLREMGRYESYGSARQIIERLQLAQGHFDTLNADMIFNLPHQSERSLRRDSEILREEIGIDQVSWYPLMASQRTGTRMQQSMGDYTLDNERPYYDLIRAAMDVDYQLASVWCFSRKAGLVDEYITADTEYIGVGSGSFSYLGGVMYANSFSIERYGRFIAKKGTAMTAVRQLTLIERARYDMVMTLFGLSMDKQKLNEKFDGRLFRILWKEILLLKLAGAVRDDGHSMTLTRKGQYEWLIIMREFFISINNFRDQMRRHGKAERDAIVSLGVETDLHVASG